MGDNFYRRGFDPIFSPKNIGVLVIFERTKAFIVDIVYSRRPMGTKMPKAEADGKINFEVFLVFLHFPQLKMSNCSKLLLATQDFIGC